MKKAIFFISLSVLLIILDIFLIFGNKDKKEQKKEKTNSNYITIKQYKLGTDEIIKEIKIINKDDIKVLNTLKKDLKPLEDYERVNLALAQEINIVYDENISVGITLSEKGYCYYINKKKKISSLSHMPKGLYEFIVKKLNIKEKNN